MVDFAKLRNSSGAWLDPAKAEPPSPETQEQIARARLYETALEELVRIDRAFVSNRNTFDRWQLDMKIWWINQIEKQAKAGLDTLGVKVVAKAIEIRLSGE
jgi:hypothetical protein